MKRYNLKDTTFVIPFKLDSGDRVENIKLIVSYIFRNFDTNILIAEEVEEALTSIVYKDEAFRVGKRIVNSLKETIPRQMFVIKIQAAISGKVIAGERISAMKKDVTAGLYGGDITRKRKLLEKQKKGKKKMMAMGKGKVDIPTEAFISVLKK